MNDHSLNIIWINVPPVKCFQLVKNLYALLENKRPVVAEERLCIRASDMV
jgi:hypothetical protein